MRQLSVGILFVLVGFLWGTTAYASSSAPKWVNITTGSPYFGECRPLVGYEIVYNGEIPRLELEVGGRRIQLPTGRSDAPTVYHYNPADGLPVLLPNNQWHRFRLHAHTSDGVHRSSPHYDYKCTIAGDLPPRIIPNQREIRVTEGAQIVVEGRYEEPNGDAVTLSSSHGEIVITHHAHWRWTWTAPDGPVEVGVLLSASDGSPPGDEIPIRIIVDNVPPDGQLILPDGYSPGAGFAVAIANVVDLSVADTNAGFLFGFDCDGDGNYETGELTEASAFCNVPALTTVNAYVRDKDQGRRNFTVAQPTHPGISCPGGTTRIDVFGSVVLQAGQSADAQVVIPEDHTSGRFVAVSMVGHPDIGCPLSADEICIQGQPNEAANLFVNGQQIAVIPDHGENQWRRFEYAHDLAPGEHNVRLEHVGAQDGSVGSTTMEVIYCAE